jgi:hypothetical protein
MTEQSKGPPLSSVGRIRVSFARWLLRYARHLAYAIAPEIKDEGTKDAE